jgi:hypothetical protein
MCTLVHRSPEPDAVPRWDAFRGVIIIPRLLLPDTQLLIVRAMLAGLGIPQPDDGATCWCGAPVEVTWVPAQRRDEGAYVAS